MEKAPFYYRNKHLQTIVPALFRKIEGVVYNRQRISTWDNDFIDLDWSRVKSQKLVILFHGLEGSAYSQYIKGLVKVLNGKSFDTVSVNFRGCSGSPNYLLSSYHSGKTDDIQFIVDSLAFEYEEINLVGFSLGGNVVLKYLGETLTNEKINKSVAISVPCDLKASAIHLSKGFNTVYLKRFFKRLKEKVRQKEEIFPKTLDYSKVYESKDFYDFDNLFTAPVHGFKDAEDYWNKCSSKQFIPTIKTPTIIINALNDPFLPFSCYPHQESKKNSNVKLLTPKYGGHVGFSQIGQKLNYYESKIIDFL